MIDQQRDHIRREIVRIIALRVTIDNAVGSLVSFVVNYATRQAALARIEEIEDISQSRNVVRRPNGTLWCSHCTMPLEDEEEDCACNVLFKKRQIRLESLKVGTSKARWLSCKL